MQGGINILVVLDPITNERIRAKPGMKAICPACSGIVISRCGDIKIWHWAHEKECIYDSEAETEWHMAWKENALKLGMEIEKIFDTSQRFRADIYDHKRNMVTEVQHSPISTETIIDRCSFYDSKGIKIRWIFDFTDRYKSSRIGIDETLTEYGHRISFWQRNQLKNIQCLVDNTGNPKYDINLNIDYDFSNNTHTTLKIENMSKDGRGHGKLFSSIIIEKEFIVSLGMLKGYRMTGKDGFYGYRYGFLKECGFTKIDNDCYIRKICNIEESVIMTERVDPYHVRIKYKGYNESEFLKNLDFAEYYFEASKSEGYIEINENDTYYPNSLDIRNIDNFADYSDSKKIMEKQQARCWKRNENFEK